MAPRGSRQSLFTSACGTLAGRMKAYQWTAGRPRQATPTSEGTLDGEAGIWGPPEVPLASSQISPNQLILLGEGRFTLVPCSHTPAPPP